MNSRNKRVKRIFDVLFSSIILIVTFPIIIVTFILIAFELKDIHSVIYKQERIGLNSKPFYIYKFRSMIVNAPLKASKDIPHNEYITRVGKIIRRTSIDELPQLINILKGEMSVVGPRPLIANEDIILTLRRQMGIDCIMPGLTGWAQIKDREITDDEHKVELDKYYLDNTSLLLDFKIIFLTVFKLRGR